MLGSAKDGTLIAAAQAAVLPIQRHKLLARPYFGLGCRADFFHCPHEQEVLHLNLDASLSEPQRSMNQSTTIFNSLFPCFMLPLVCLSHKKGDSKQRVCSIDTY